jgi:membrane protein implicated in regulation of membrane protease activity
MLRKLWSAVKAPFNKAIDKAQATFPPNRIVALLTPLVFVPVSGFVSAWVAKHFPGLPAFSSAQITGFMLVGALSALAAGYKWVDGWQKAEERGETKAPKRSAKSATATVHVHVADEKKLGTVVENAVASAGAKAAKL